MYCPFPAMAQGVGREDWLACHSLERFDLEAGADGVALVISYKRGAWPESLKDMKSCIKIPPSFSHLASI